MMPLLLPLGHTNQFEQTRLNQQPIQLEEPIIMSINEKYSRESSRFHPCEDSLKITDISPPVEDSRKKMISLDKPIGESLSGTKRKSTSPVAECSSAERSKKKVKEWSCAICQVSTTSKHSLNEHLGGKKHKVKVAAGANFGLGVTPIINPLKLALTTANPTKKASTTKMENEKKRGS